MKLKNLLKTKIIIDRIFGPKSALVIGLIFGLYYKLSSSPMVCYITRVYCILIFALSTWVFTDYVDSMFSKFATNTFLLVLFVEASLCRLIAFSFEGDQFIEFHLKFKSWTQGHLQFLQLTYIPHLAISLLLIWNLFEYLRVRNFPSVKLFYMHTLFYFMLTTIFSSHYTLLYITNTYRQGIRFVRMSMCDKLKNRNMPESEKFLRIRSNMNTYKSLTNIFISVNKLLRTKVIISFTCLFLRFVLVVIFFITSSEIILGWTNELFFHSVMVCLPSIFMECVSKDLEAIKAILSEQLVACKDKRMMSYLSDAIEYIDVCSSRYYTAWNGLLIDINLALSFTSLCSTYAIAILQFTY